MYRHYTVHVDTEDPAFTEKLAKVIQESGLFSDQTNAIELREVDLSSLTGDRFVAAWESE